MAYIYKITNVGNEKVYIGMTSRTYNRRITEHKTHLKNNTHGNAYLQRAWNKYGSDSFVFELIEECDENEVVDRESFWISAFDSANRDYGYNIDLGGRGSERMSQETKDKLRDISLKLNQDPVFLKKRNEGTKRGSDNCKAVSVICINEMKVFGSAIEASEHYEVPYKNLHQVLLGKNNCAFNAVGIPLQFSYYKEGETYRLKELKNINKPKRVRCITTGEEFDSTGKAAKEKGLMQSKISLVCNGKRNYTGLSENGEKLIWEFC